MESSAVQCVGFIMDGNRRWAKAQGKETLEGHREGLLRFRDVLTWVHERNIPHAVFYAFSTENWRRSEAEVAYLMKLFREAFSEMSKLSNDQNVRVIFIGRRTDFAPDLQAELKTLEEKTAANTGTTIWIALSYGGRAEIVAAAQALAAQGSEITEDTFAAALFTAGMPDPDLIIRTSGEQRLSNFLPWQSVYSELFFTPTYWPAFTKEEFTRILDEYENRERRHGA